MVRAELALLEATPSSDLTQAKEWALSAFRDNQLIKYNGRALQAAVVHARLCMHDGRGADAAHALLTEALAAIDDTEALSPHLDTVLHSQQLLQQLGSSL
jgi:hypothetical protein